MSYLLRHSYFILFSFVILTFLNCKNVEKKDDTNKIDSLAITDYLKNDINVNLESNQLFIVLTTNACSGCTTSVTNYLKQNTQKRNNITLIVIGNTKKETAHLVKGLENTHTIHYDTKAIGYSKLKSDSNAIIEMNNNKITAFFPFDINTNVALTLNTISR